jgi:predicted Zn-dependent protease with MMP-like domain
VQIDKRAAASAAAERGAAPDGSRRRRTRRDRHGRGLRAPLAPREVPLSAGPAHRFDDLVVDAVEDVESHWASELADVEFAVEDVPSVPTGAGIEFDPDLVSDRGVPLGRLYRQGLRGDGPPSIVVYRRPLEARSQDGMLLADLVFAVVAELAAELLGKDLDEFERGD